MTADFGQGSGLLARLGPGETSTAVEFRAGQAREITASLVSQPAESSTRVAVVDERELHIIARSRMEILRSLANGSYARVTFGTARFRWEEQNGYGIYEYAAITKSKPPSDEAGAAKQS
jgi:hypothetical protein